MSESFDYTPSFFYLYLSLFCLVAIFVLLFAVLLLVREMAKSEPPDDAGPEIRKGWLWHEIQRRIK